MRVQMLGPLDVVDAEGRPVGEISPKERRRLAVLAVHANEAVSEARLIDALWGDDPPKSAVKTLQSYVSRLRLAQGDSAAARSDLTIALKDAEELAMPALAAEIQGLLDT